jgi:hypothetical protein
MLLPHRPRFSPPRLLFSAGTPPRRRRRRVGPCRLSTVSGRRKLATPDESVVVATRQVAGEELVWGILPVAQEESSACINTAPQAKRYFLGKRAEVRPKRRSGEHVQINIQKGKGRCISSRLLPEKNIDITYVSMSSCLFLAVHVLYPFEHTGRHRVGQLDSTTTTTPVHFAA